MDLLHVGEFLKLIKVLASRAPAAPSDKLNLRQSFGELNKDGKAFVRAGINHADLEFVDVVPLNGHASSASIEVGEGAVNKERRLESSVLPSVVSDGLRDHPNSFKLSKQLVLDLRGRAMTQNAVAVRAERQLLGSVDDIDSLERGPQGVVSRDFHRDGIVEDDMSRTVRSDMFGEDVDQGLHALSNGAVLENEC